MADPAGGREPGRGLMIEIVHVVKVEKLGGHQLRVCFSDGAQGERDFADIVAEGGDMVEPLREPAFFARVFIECGVLAWPNGFDLDAVALHMEMIEQGLLRRTAAAVVARIEVSLDNIGIVANSHPSVDGQHLRYSLE